MTKAIANALKHGIDDVLVPAVQDAGKTVKKAMHSVADGAEKVAGHAEEAESHAVQEFAKAGKDVHASDGRRLGTVATKEELRKGLGPTPVYKIGDDGVVRRLTSEGPKALEEADRARLAPMKLDGADKVPGAEPGKYRLPPLKKGEVRPTTESEQVPFGEDELSRATQLARHEDGSFGSYAKREGTGPTADEPNRPAQYDFTSNNYASARYGKAGDENGFILVGRSRNPNPHSERVLGIPMLESGSAGGLTAVYTERAPCTSAPNCSSWMKHFLPSGVQVTHSASYGGAADRAAGNSDMEQYLNALRPKPHPQFKP